ncbi:MULTISPECIES: beta-ketoacyl synthase N-terminal-like domain-containing protein [Paenibacillus]|uniref:hotdog fold thioesterase n=1 Tax=Paenibacillus TaxID=44249 RepID=UPI00119CFAF2|nr:beta-ketoacyl synthase N-terminal-like domain-containing protein [Paenibacillus sp. Y412MC10]
MTFEPIAIVGQGCVLPGALHPEELWNGVLAGRSLLSEPETARWRVSREQAETNRGGERWSLRGGYVHGFEQQFDPSEYAVDRDEWLRMDRMVHWMLHAAGEAIRTSGTVGFAERERTGVIVGNLSLPTVSLAQYAESTWLRRQGLSASEAARIVGAQPQAIDRFMSGYPAFALAKALGLGGEAYCLDAACASSLYAIKLACDSLHDGRADLMLAGAVNGAEPLFLHTGFRALQAVSKTGQSRPFHSQADGLVPAEGCGFVALKRLPDAVRDGNRVLGVIRAVGLSNDGGRSGLLAPSAAGQAAAMRQAYRQSGLSPSDISLIECHATGTPLGDATEIGSMSDVFAGLRDVPIGSIKSNIGHALTAAGIAGLIKVLGSLNSGMLPPSLFGEETIEALRESPFRLLREAEPWRCDGRRRAAINSFGFGGNNAHLIVEQYEPAPERAAVGTVVRLSPMERAVAREDGRRAPTDGRLAIVGIGAIVADGGGTDDFAAALFGLDQQPRSTKAETVELPLAGIAVPPNDLMRALPQQLQMLKAAKAAVAEARELPSERTGIYIGMQIDAEIARHCARMRLAERQPVQSAAARDGVQLEAARERIFPQLDAPTLVGLLPNIPANRLNKLLNVSGPGFTVSSEELSGITALAIAARALREGELDAAIVGAVDFSGEYVHETAVAEWAGPDAATAGDAAVAIVVKRLADAERDRNVIYAVLPVDVEGMEPEAEQPGLLLGDEEDEVVGDVINRGAHGRKSGDVGAVRLERRFGKAHAAHGLLHVAAGALSLRYGLCPAFDGGGPQPWPASEPRTARVSIAALGGVKARVALASHDAEGAESAGDGREQRLRVDALLARVAEAGRDRDASPSIAVAAHRPPVELSAFVQSLPHAVGVADAPNVATAPRTAAPAVMAAVPPPAGPPIAGPMRQPTGPAFSREQLEQLASGPISAVFGPAFADQIGYRRQVRMPEPPLLLADRVIGIDAAPHSMGTGTIWTETDVDRSRDYMHKGRMPLGYMIEAGQADLLLISWLGIDRYNKGDRVYRLLGCEITFHGPLPRHGETLTYQIEADSHAKSGDMRLFFFHNDCYVGAERRLTTRGGQAGFFTDEELANSGGVLWDPAKATPRAGARLDPPEADCTHSRFTPGQVNSFAQGRPYDCFGPGFERAMSHTSSPSIQHGDRLFFQEVTCFDPLGGPLGRGYLRAEAELDGTEWFFPCHFTNDPVMPGTMMLEGCVQAMSFYIAAMGFTLNKDGWRFEPVLDVPYRMVCRGQVTPASRKLIYEVYVQEVVGGETPTLFADVLFTVDGLKAFHCAGLGIRLVPDYQLETSDVRPGR